MGNTFFFEWEIDFIVWIQTFINGFTTLLAKFLQICGEEYVLIFVLGLLYWSIDKKLGRRASLAMVGSMLLGISGFFYCSDTEFYSGYGVALGLFLGFMFEEKYVKFEYCKKWWTYIRCLSVCVQALQKPLLIRAVREVD